MKPPANIKVEPIDDAILDRTVTLAFGQYRYAKQWKNRTMTVETLLAEWLNKYSFGEKDGPAITSGELVTDLGQRASARVKHNDIVMVDIDTGGSLDDIEAQIRGLGLFACMWTTYSHMKPATDVNEKHFHAWMRKKNRTLPASVDDMGPDLIDYLMEVKRKVPALFVDGVTVKREMQDDGIAYLVGHIPAPRCRALFVLDKPFDFTEGHSQADRISEWKTSYTALADMLRVEWDKVCIDPARLMYLPRVADEKKLATAEFRLINGKMLDLAAYAVADKSKISANADTNQFTEAALGVATLHKSGKTQTGHSHSGGTRFTPATPGLLQFVAKYPDFDPIALLNDYAPEGLRGHSNTEEKIEFKCPYEDGHTSQDPEQTAFFVSTRDGSWYMGCMTDGCKTNGNNDRLYFLDAIMREYQIPIDALNAYSELRKEDLAKRSAETDKVEAQQASAEKDLIEALTPDSPTHKINEALAYVKTLPSKIDRTRALAKVTEKTGIGKRDLETSMKELDEVKEEKEDDRKMPDDLTKAHTIWVDDWGWENAIKAVKARFSALNDKDPKIFARPEGGAKMRLCFTPDRVFPEDMRSDHWDAEISEKMRFMAEDNYGQAKSVAPPKMLRPVLSGTDALTLPALRGITRIAIPAADGSMPTVKGYHHASETYFDPNYEPRVVSDVVTEDEVDEAVYWLMEAVRDFPFSDAFDGNEPLPIKLSTVDSDGFPDVNWERGQSSRAHAIAMLIQPVARNMIDGPCPAYHIDKASPGTGAGYLANVLYTIMTGSTAQPMTMSESNEEFGKAVTSTLREGSPLIFIDNINRHVDSDVLASALTTGFWKGRVLGKSEMASIPITATWVMAGNNLTFSNELMRRLIPIRMDAVVPDPANDRGSADFKHFPLQNWLKENRTNLIWAAQTLVRNWIQKGRPRGKRVINSFDDWSTTMGGIMDAATIPGFLDCIANYMKNKNVAKAGDNRIGYAAAQCFGGAAFTTSELFTECADPTSKRLPMEWPVRGQNEHGQMTSLGMFLAGTLATTTFDIPAKLMEKDVRRTKVSTPPWKLCTKADPYIAGATVSYYRVKCVKNDTDEGTSYQLIDAGV